MENYSREAFEKAQTENERSALLEQGQHEANVVKEITDKENKKPEAVINSLASFNAVKSLVEKCSNAENKEKIEPNQEVVSKILKKLEASVTKYRDAEFKVESLEEINGAVYGLIKYKHLDGFNGMVWNTSELHAIAYGLDGSFSHMCVDSRGDNARVFQDGDKIMAGVFEFRSFDEDKSKGPDEARFYEMDPQSISKTATFDRSLEYQINNVDEYVSELEGLKAAVENSKTEEEYVDALVKVAFLESEYDNLFSKANKSNRVYHSPLEYIRTENFVKDLPSSDYKLIEIQKSSPNVIQNDGKGYGSHNSWTRFVLVNPKDRKVYKSSDTNGSFVGNSWTTSGVSYKFSSLDENDKEIRLIGKRNVSGSTGWDSMPGLPGPNAYGREIGKGEEQYILIFPKSM